MLSTLCSKMTFLILNLLKHMLFLSKKVVLSLNFSFLDIRM